MVGIFVYFVCMCFVIVIDVDDLVDREGIVVFGDCGDGVFG